MNIMNEYVYIHIQTTYMYALLHHPTVNSKIRMSLRVIKVALPCKNRLKYRFNEFSPGFRHLFWVMYHLNISFVYFQFI